MLEERVGVYQKDNIYRLYSSLVGYRLFREFQYMSTSYYPHYVGKTSYGEIFKVSTKISAILH